MQAASADLAPGLGNPGQAGLSGFTVSGSRGPTTTAWLCLHQSFKEGRGTRAQRADSLRAESRTGGTHKVPQSLNDNSWQDTGGAVVVILGQGNRDHKTQKDHDTWGGGPWRMLDAHGCQLYLSQWPLLALTTHLPCSCPCTCVVLLEVSCCLDSSVLLFQQGAWTRPSFAGPERSRGSAR